MAKKTITSLFNQAKNAQDVVAQVENIKSADVSLFTKDKCASYEPPADMRQSDILAGRAGKAVGINTIATQDFGMDNVGGPFIGLISEELMANMVNGLSSYGLPEAFDEHYKNDVADGSIYCRIKARKEDAEKIVEILKKNEAINICLE